MLGRGLNDVAEKKYRPVMFNAKGYFTLPNF
jgi:hypothetical protein